MQCPHCLKLGKSKEEAEVSDTYNARAWDMANALDPKDPGTVALDGDDLAATAGFDRQHLEAVKRHYRDHLLPQLGLALAYDHRTNLYWLTPSWNDLMNPDIRTWGSGMLNRLYHESRHVRDALEVGWKNMPTKERKARLQVKDVYQLSGHVVDRLELALESAALLPPPSPSGP